ncbi:MAG: L,D-transpeptidase [Ignavibacteria bacterium]
MKSIEAGIGMPDLNLDNDERNKLRYNPHIYLYSFGLPVIIALFVLAGFWSGSFLSSKFYKNGLVPHTETKSGEIKNGGKFNILSKGDMSSGIKDTVYTDKDCWLELRIDQQMVYEHWRDGRTEKYPVSSGNNKSGDPEALESRPGLFAIFVKEEHHQSTQFNSANMYHFMPFNQGIGFHSIDGTGYYAHLGVRPSSHGCIRMKHEDAKKLYKDCELGTLVIASKGYSARTVSFAPEGFKNEKEYTKEEYKSMLASNLYNILKGRYYLEEKEKFVVDPKVIPVSGVYVSYDVKIPENQEVPRSFLTYIEVPDRSTVRKNDEILKDEHSEEFIKFISEDSGIEEMNNDKKHVTSSEDIVKKYFNNPIGVLPYFGPKK